MTFHDVANPVQIQKKSPKGKLPKGEILFALICGTFAEIQVHYFNLKSVSSVYVPMIISYPQMIRYIRAFLEAMISKRDSSDLG